MPDQVLDVRALRKPDRHPTAFQAYQALGVGESLVLVNDHDPRHLREEFDTEHPGSHRWEYLDQAPGEWRVRITKLASTPLPRVVGDVHALTTGEQDATGAVWTVPARYRDLDANVIHLPPGTGIDPHAGPDLDVLLLVIAGSGRLSTELGEVDLTTGSLVWLPRRSTRGFAPGPDGLTYLTVHQHRKSLVLATGPAGGPAG